MVLRMILRILRLPPCDTVGGMLASLRRLGALCPRLFCFLVPALLFFFEPGADRPVESYCTLVAPCRRRPGELGGSPCVGCLPGGVRAFGP